MIMIISIKLMVIVISMTAMEINHRENDDDYNNDNVVVKINDCIKNNYNKKGIIKMTKRR